MLKVPGLYFHITPWPMTNYLHMTIFFFQLGFTPCKAEKPLQGMELQEKEAQKD